ncbi:MAG: VOC family protein [Pseudomonadota bacterium]
MEAARRDYAKLFGWKFDGAVSYDFATLDGEAVAAVFPMPERLAKMKMPSFWMSYVRVQNLDATVAKARTHEGAIIEVEPQAFNVDARVALVRDPSGAGFTLYEGPDISSPSGVVGTVEQRYHHLPDVGLITSFYADLFGWRFAKTADTPWPTYEIRHTDGATVAIVEETPEQIRGKFRYWIPCFSAPSREVALSRLSAMNGEVSYELDDQRLIVRDRQGAHFMLRTTDDEKNDDRRSDSDTRSAAVVSIPWRALFGLCLIWLAVFLEVQAFWGVLFLIWIWPSVKVGRAEFLEAVYRSKQPVTYWALIGTWVVLSVWLIARPLLGTFLD